MDLRRPIAVMVAAVVSLSVLLTTAPATLAAPRVIPQVGERFLTPLERATVLESMPPLEREALGAAFEDDAAGLVVGYARAYFRLVDEDGTVTVEPIGMPSDTTYSAISIPSLEVANSATQSVAGTDLYISMIVRRTRTTSPYEWDIQVYSQWHPGSRGMGNWNNGSRDRMAVAWSGDPAYHSSTWSSRYKTNAQCGAQPMNVVQEQVRTYGVDWSFNEWRWGTCEAHWALMNTRTRESTWRNRIATVKYHYYHTFTSLTYSVTLSRTPAISISPTQSQWSAGIGVSYTY